MNYNVTTLTETHSGNTVDLVHHGNKYYVYYYIASVKEGHSSQLCGLEDALMIFEKFVEAFAYGEGDDNYRISLLK